MGGHDIAFHVVASALPTAGFTPLALEQRLVSAGGPNIYSLPVRIAAMTRGLWLHFGRFTRFALPRRSHVRFRNLGSSTQGPALCPPKGADKGRPYVRVEYHSTTCSGTPVV